MTENYDTNSQAIDTLLFTKVYRNIFSEKTEVTFNLTVYTTWTISTKSISFQILI